MTTISTYVPPLGCLIEGNREIHTGGQTHQSHQSFFAQLGTADWLLGRIPLHDQCHNCSRSASTASWLGWVKSIESKRYGRAVCQCSQWTNPTQLQVLVCLHPNMQYHHTRTWVENEQHTIDVNYTKLCQYDKKKVLALGWGGPGVPYLSGRGWGSDCHTDTPA